MAQSIKKYPRLIDHMRHARNGHIPEAVFLKRMLDATNHICSFRRKTFASWGDYDNDQNGASGTTNLYRFRCHSGYAATHFAFRMGLSFVDNAASADPTVTIDCTISGGATTSESVHYGLSSSTPNDSPDEVSEQTVLVAVSPNTTYEVLIKVVDYARIRDFCAYEVASPNITVATDHYVNPAEGAVGYPIFDSTREELLKATSEMWRKNGSHYFSWCGPPTGALSVGTTWTNLFDSTTAVSGASAKVRLYPNAETLTLGRLSDSGGTVVDAVMAVYAQSVGGNTGEVRFQHSGGTLCSVTGITTTAGWFTSTTTLTDLQDIYDLDIQYRNSNGAHSLASIGAVCLYAYLA